jgi:sugar O-acyltransferase (sialic acid O-acetyltransferase NeuD family)
MNRKALLIGGGGHAKVLLDILNGQGITIEAIISPKVDLSFSLFKNVKHFKNDDDVLRYNTDEVVLVNGVGSLPGDLTRASIFDNFQKYGYEFSTVVPKSSIVSEYCKLGMGVQIMPGAIINADARVGDNTIINSGAIIEHDCRIGSHNHIAPGAVLSGGVVTGDNVHISTGAKVIQGMKIGARAMVGAGATVSKDLGNDKKLYVAKPFTA